MQNPHDLQISASYFSNRSIEEVHTCTCWTVLNAWTKLNIICYTSEFVCSNWTEISNTTSTSYSPEKPRTKTKTVAGVIAILQSCASRIAVTWRAPQICGNLRICPPSNIEPMSNFLPTFHFCTRLNPVHAFSTQNCPLFASEYIRNQSVPFLQVRNSPLFTFFIHQNPVCAVCSNTRPEAYLSLIWTHSHTNWPKWDLQLKSHGRNLTLVDTQRLTHKVVSRVVANGHHHGWNVQ